MRIRHTRNTHTIRVRLTRLEAKRVKIAYEYDTLYLALCEAEDELSEAVKCHKLAYWKTPLI